MVSVGEDQGFGWSGELSGDNGILPFSILNLTLKEKGKEKKRKAKGRKEGRGWSDRSIARLL